MTGDVRDRILGLLSAGPATVARLSAGLGVPGGVVNYELKLLERDGLVRVGTTRLDRGVATPVYVSTAAAAPPPLLVPPPIPGVTWLGEGPYPTPLWTVPHPPAPDSSAGGAGRSSAADAQRETPEFEPGAAVDLPPSAYTGISFPTRPHRAGAVGASTGDPARPAATAGPGSIEAAGGREPAVAASGSREAAATKGGSADRAVKASGSRESAVTPGGSADWAVTSGGSGESAVDPGGSGESAVTPGGSGESAVTPGGSGTSGSAPSAGRGRAVGWGFPAGSGDTGARPMPTAGQVPQAVPQPRRFRPATPESPRAPRLHDMRRVPMDAATFYEFAERLDALAREFASRATPGAPAAELTILLTRPEGDGTSGYGYGS